MSTVKTLAEQIANRLGRINDFVLKKDISYSILDTYAILVRQEYSRTGKLPSSTIQTLNCVELETVDKYECCGPDECTALRTKLTIPKLIDTKSPTPFEYVGSIDLANPYTHVSLSRLGLVSERRFKTKQDKLNILYTYRNDRIYILNKPTLEYISISSAFADPDNLNNCCESCSGSCYDKDGQFNLSTNYAREIRNLLYKEYGISQEEKKSEYEIDINK